MSFKEIVSDGEDLVVERAAREFGGARQECFRINGSTGDVSVQGNNLNGPGAVLSVRKALTSAQVKTLHGTPVQVIPKAPAGKYIEIISMHAMLKYGTVGYDSVGASDFLELRYTNGSGALLTATASPVGFGDATANAHATIAAASSGWTPANANVVAFIAAGEWYAAAGDSALHLEVLYRLRDLAI